MFTGHQALSVANGFASQIAKCGYIVWACCVQPQHTHLVIRRHHYSAEQVGRSLKQAATLRLLADGLHPFADRRSAKGFLPSVWAQDLWKVFLYTSEDVTSRIRYVENNPLKEGKPRQRWSFVVPFDPTSV